MAILFKNITIITQNKKRDIISRGFIIVDNGKIIKIGKNDSWPKISKRQFTIIDGKDLIVAPSFINLHVHLGESAFKFLNRRYSLEEYLNITNKISQKVNLIEQCRNVIADYSMLLILLSGTSVICGGRITASINRWRIRGINGYMIMNSFKLRQYYKNIYKNFNKEYKLIKKNKLITPAIFIHSLATISVDKINIVRKILEIYPDTKLIIHVAETKKQEEFVKSIWGNNSIEVLYKNKLLSPQTILIHGNWIKGKEINLIKKNGAVIVHCLSSNINVADKVSNIKNLINKKIKITIGTDGLITGESLNILNEARANYLYHNISARKIFDMITIDAAKFLNMDNYIGSIEEEKVADLVFINKNFLIKDKLNIVEKIIMSGNRKIIYGLMVAGNFKLWEGNFIDKNANQIIKKFNNLVVKIKKQYENSSYKSTV